MAAPNTVVIDAEYESEWYLIPKGFSTHVKALQYAAGIAKAWEDQSGVPAIWIKGGEMEARWSVGTLLAVASWYGWFDGLARRLALKLPIHRSDEVEMLVMRSTQISPHNSAHVRTRCELLATM